MKRFVIILIISVLALSLSCDRDNKIRPIAQKGVIDLRNWNFKHDGNIKLKGEWEFYWKKLLSPADFAQNKYEKQYFKVPNYWNYKILNKNHLDGIGYATYRLTILHDKADTLGICLGEQLTAYKFWCDTNQIASSGQVATNKEEAKPSMIHKLKMIHLSADSTQIIFQISNFNHSKGGFYSVPNIGKMGSLYAKKSSNFAVMMFLLGGILLIAMYHLGVYILRKEDTAPFLLFLFAVSLSIITAFSSSHYISSLFSELSWELSYRIQYAVTYLSAAILAGFVRKIYYKDISKKNTYLYIGAIMVASTTIFMPAEIFTCTLISGTLIIVSAGFYIFVLLKQVIHKRHGSRIFVVSFLIYILSVSNDVILVNTFFVWDIELIPLGTLIFILGQSLVYARVAVQTLNEKKVLSNKLRKKNLLISTINKDLKRKTLNLKKSEAKMRCLIQMLPEAIFEFDKNGDITLANDEFYRQLFYMPQNSLNVDDLISKSDDDGISFMDFILKSAQYNENIRELRINMLRGDDSKFPATISISHAAENPDKQSFRGIFVDISQRITDEEIIDNAFKEIQSKNQNILESLKYAHTIQNAVMPTQEAMTEIFKDYFIINKPHSIVSGDFYYVNKKEDKIIFALSDCTGHGVPGGFMTMLGVTLLNELYGGNKIPEPNDTLERMRTSIINGLHQNNDYFSNKDGMDIVLCTIDIKSLEMKFASAKQTFYLVRNDELFIYKGDKSPVGIHVDMKSFTLNKLQLKKGDILYFFSDGIVDNFGGKNDKRLYPKGLRKIIKKYYKEPVEKQGILIEKELNEWLGNSSQIDDMLMIGFKV